MDRLRFKTGRFCHSLGSTPRGRRQEYVHSLRLKITDDHIDGCRFSGAGSSG